MNSPEYLAKTPKSKELFERSVKVTPGGAHHSPAYYEPYPLFYRGGKGSKIYDVDGNEYIDYSLGYSVLVLGHSHPAVLEAVKQQLEEGSHLVTNEKQIVISELIHKHVPCAEKVKLTDSGSLATMYAIRLANAFTGRKKILKFQGSIHGMDDSFMVEHNSLGKLKFVSGGIPPRIADDVLVAQFNDIEAVEKIFEEEGGDIAAVITEPVMRGIPPKNNFLKKLRHITEKKDALLIFDEVVTGFRLSLGGAQQIFDVKPDLATFGKIIGGGFPIAAFAGREDIMVGKRNRQN